MNWLEPIKSAAGLERWLQLIETLRSVTEGKIFLETPRARVTLLLALYNESQANSASTPVDYLRLLQTASDLLSDLQVETYSSMERREKTEYLVEQMRLLILVAQTKDKQAGKESLSDGEPEWVKARVGGRKVNEAFLKESGNEDLKLKYYELMIQYALHESAYLNVAKYYYKIWETPSIREDVDGKGREALEHIVYYIILAPHENEQSDMLHRLSQDPALAKLERHFNLVKCFTTQELMRWTGIEGIYGETLRATAVFGPAEGEKRYQDFHTRVTEHNVRVVSRYYTRISIKRLMSLLDLTTEQAEETLSRLVVSKMIWARIDRPSGVISFRSERNAEDIMNDWSFDMQRLLGLVEKSWMGMNAAQAAQGQAGRAKA